MSNDAVATKFELFTTAVTLIAAVVAAGWIAMQWTAPTRRKAALLPKQPIDASAAHWRGSATATKGVLVFSDFECPYCGELAMATLPTITKELVSTGQARLGFLSYPLESIHRHALAAAVAAECASEQGRFWEMHDLLFADQQRLAVEHLLDRSRQLGLDDKGFSACLAGTGEVAVRASQALSKKLSLPGTPVVLVGEFLPGGEFEAAEAFSGMVDADKLIEAVRGSGSHRKTRAAIAAIALIVATSTVAWWRSRRNAKPPAMVVGVQGG